MKMQRYKVFPKWQIFVYIISFFVPSHIYVQTWRAASLLTPRDRSQPSNSRTRPASQRFGNHYSKAIRPTGGWANSLLQAFYKTLRGGATSAHPGGRLAALTLPSVTLPAFGINICMFEKKRAARAARPSVINTNRNGGGYYPPRFCLVQPSWSHPQCEGCRCVIGCCRAAL